MMRLDGVVVLMPAYQSSHTLPAVLDRLLLLDPQPVMYVFCENNSTDETLRLLSTFHGEKKILRLWFRPDALGFCDTPYDVIATVRDMLLKYVRRLDPDFALFLDSDVIPGPNVIEMLTAHNTDIVGGVLLRPHGSPHGDTIAAMPLDPGQRSLSPFGAEEVAAVGGGCMCVNRRVIQDRRLSFYPVGDAPPGYPPGPGFESTRYTCEDWGYCLAARRLGYHVWLDAMVKLHHYAGPPYRLTPWTVGLETLKPLPFVFTERRLPGTPKVTMQGS